MFLGRGVCCPVRLFLSASDAGAAGVCGSCAAGRWPKARQAVGRLCFKINGNFEIWRGVRAAKPGQADHLRAERCGFWSYSAARCGVGNVALLWATFIYPLETVPTF